MKKARNCDNTSFNTGVSKCPLAIGKMKGAIIVKHGQKLPADMTAEKLEELIHADRDTRAYGVVEFVEYAKNGGEAQTSATGYGAEQFTGISAQKDTFTLDKFYPELHAALTKSANVKRDVYFFDENNVLYGMSDGTDVLAGFPMSAIYSDATPFPTSSANPVMTITFAHANAKKAIIGYDFIQLDFAPASVTLGLTPVVLVKESGSAYKILEKVGGYDVTAIYGPLIATAGSTVIDGTATAVTYSEENDNLTITTTGDAVPRLKSAKVLYANDIKGIEQA